jgi:hypothetical protein
MEDDDDDDDVKSSVSETNYVSWVDPREIGMAGERERERDRQTDRQREW